VIAHLFAWLHRLRCSRCRRAYRSLRDPRLVVARSWR